MAKDFRGKVEWTSGARSRTGSRSSSRSHEPSSAADRAAEPLHLLAGRVDVPESVAVNVRRRSYTIAAGAAIERDDAEGVLFAQGGVAGGHSLFVEDGRLRYTYNWLGERIQDVVSDAPITTGKHVFTAEFQKTGDDDATLSAIGTLTLYIDNEPVGKTEIWTQPGFFGLTGDGLCVGRDGNSPVSPEYPSPFPFTGGTIDRVIVDVRGDRYVDHEKEVLDYLARD